MSPGDVASTVLLGLGGFIMLAGAVGVLRFPDFYTRLHAAGKGDTLGQGLILIGLAISAGFGLVTFKLALIILFVFVLNPTATHALARGAWIAGLQPWEVPGRKPDSERGEEPDA